jgi:acetyltransferase-like isoleucine patch superfamily enzyme
MQQWTMNVRRTYLEHDWYSGGVPANVILGEDAYLDSSYAFAMFLARRKRALTLGRACGAYDRATFVVGPNGRVRVGSFTCLNGVYLVCHQEITVGDHCLLAWGSVITDSPVPQPESVAERRSALRAAAEAPDRWLPAVSPPRPVTIEDNVWVGFDSVVLPGVHLGRGCIVGCKSVVSGEIPAYAVCVGNPGRVVRYLDPDDTPRARQLAFRESLREP